MKVIPFSPPDITEEEVKEVAAALLSGWITTGPRTKELEKVIASYCGVPNCVCLNSQTACAELCLRLLGVGPGDEVILPAYTYTATCSVVCHVGAIPVLIDSQKDCIEMDYDKVADAITEKTKVIIPVDVGGVPCDYDKIFEIVNIKKDLFKPMNDIQKSFGRIIILADTAHSLGASYHRKKTGNVADFSAFSFHAVKNMTTAEGGALTWKDIPEIDSGELYHQLQLLSLHGQSKDALAKTKIGAWEYDIVGPWYKCNMTDIASAIGLIQMKRFPELLERRKYIVNEFNNGLKHLDVEYLDHLNPVKSSSCHLYIVRLNGYDEKKRNMFIDRMARYGVACNVHYKPLPMFTAYKNFGFDIKDFPNAYDFYHNEITLPLHTCLSDDDVAYIIDAFRKCYFELFLNYG